MLKNISKVFKMTEADSPVRREADEGAFVTSGFFSTNCWV